MAHSLDASRNYSYLAIIAFFGFLGFMEQPTAYTWGEQDMMPFFERVFDPGYLTKDFFTNTTIAKNPRWVYGYLIVAISWITDLPWYQVLYTLKLLFLMLMPILYYEVLIAILRKYIDEKTLSWVSLLVMVCLILIVYVEDYRYYFSVAAWWSYAPDLHSYKVSMALCFVGILLKERGGHPIAYLSLFFLSCIMHPVMGLFSIGFYTIFLLPEFRKERKRLLPVLVTAVVAVVIVKLVFASKQVLTTPEFIDIYVKERHPWHYSVPDFTNPKGDWFIFFAFLNILFAAPLVYGILKKRRTLWLLSLFALICYSGSVAAQYIFIEIIPTKLIAYLGISRFTIFGYWMLVVLWGLLVSDLIKTDKPFVFPSLGSKNFAFIIVNLIFVGMLFIDNPKEAKYNSRKAYYDFVQSTAENTIFITYSRRLNTDMRIIGRRGVFTSYEFPFAEQFIDEYGKRRKAIFGSRQDGSEGIVFYRSLGPKDFKEISKKYQLDYILIENDYDDQFSKNEPVWKNNEHSIYRVENLRF